MPEQPPRDKNLLQTVQDDPDAVDVDVVIKLLDQDNGTLRNMGLMALSTIALDEPERVVDHSGTIIEHLEDGFPVAESTAALVLSRLADEYPEAVRPAIPRLVELLDQMPPLTGYRAGRAIGPMLKHYPEDFVPVVDDLLAITSDPPEAGVPSEAEFDEMAPDIREKVEDQLSDRGEEVRKDFLRCYGIREIAVHALVEVSDIEPGVFVDRLDELRPSFDTKPPVARAAAMDVVANVAKHDPDAVDPVVDDVIERARSDKLSVRARAIQALGFAQATEAIGPLREIAESDDDAVSEDLPDLAIETADYLEANA